MPKGRNNLMSIHRRMDKQNVVYPLNGILLNRKKECILMHATIWQKLGNLTLSE
jgi:hypothetical protein